MRRLFALVAAVILVDTMFYAAIVPLLPTYVDELGLSKTGAGILSASYAAGTLAASIPAGFFAARVGVRAAVLTGLALLAGSSLAFAFADDVVLLDLARFAQGIGGASAWTGGLTWIMAAAPRERRGQLIGSALAVAIAGIMLGPVLGASAVELGAEPVFSAVAVIAVLITFWAAMTPAVQPQDPLGARTVATSILSAPVLVAFWFVALPAVFSGLYNVLVPLRLDELGASGVTIGAVFLISAAIEAVISPAIGTLSDRRGRMSLIRAGLAVAIAIPFLLAAPGSVVVLGAMTVVAVLGLALMWTPSMALLSDRAESVGLDLAFGAALVNLAWAGGQVLGGSAGPGLAEATSDTLAYAAVAAMFALTLAIVAIPRVRTA